VVGARVEQVGRMPLMRTSGLRFSRIISSVFSSGRSPRSERYSHCTGHDHALGGREGVDGEQSERRGVSMRM